MQEIERRISTQAEHIRSVRNHIRIWYLCNFISIFDNLSCLQQNNLIKAREEKYQSRVRVLETLASGTIEETQVFYEKILWA